MSTEARSPRVEKSPRPPNMRFATLDDHEQITRLEASYGMQTRSDDDWRAMWLKNPLWPRVGKDWSIGWIFEDMAGRVVGSLVSVPSLYHFRGRELICAIGRAWVMAHEYRGYGLWIISEYLNYEKADLLIHNTVGEMAIGVLDQLSSRVPLGDWETIAYWVTGYRTFAEKALTMCRVPSAVAGPVAYPAGVALRVKDALLVKSLPPAPRSITVEAIEQFDGRFDAFWQELVCQNPDKLLAARDSQALAWHFMVPMRLGRVWIYTAARNGLLRAYCILKRDELPGNITRMRVIDYQSLERDEDLLPGLLETARRRCVAEGIGMLEHLGCGLPKMRSLDQHAPYRRKIRNWPFFYRVPDPALTAELSKPEAWDPSAFDGDVSFE